MSIVANDRELYLHVSIQVLDVLVIELVLCSIGSYNCQPSHGLREEAIDGRPAKTPLWVSQSPPTNRQG